MTRHRPVTEPTTQNTPADTIRAGISSGPTRREFMAMSALSATALATMGLSGWGSRAEGRTGGPEGVQPGAAGKPGKLSILILGGTGFLGPACTEAALARGHQVTHFNRGRTEQRRKDAGRPSAVPDGVEEIFGNRDPEKTADDWKNNPNDNPKKEALDPKSPKGLTSLQGRKWDAVIDTSGYWPRMVKASAEALASSVGQYVFISTISVYAGNEKPNTETSPLGVLTDPKTEDFGPQMGNYGPGKAACEAAAEAAMPGRVTNIRPGFIVGRRDTSSRFQYWPCRAALGGEMVVPGERTDPIQIIDVRDLADWIIHCIENKVFGVFNATGPAQPLTMDEFVRGCALGVTREGVTPATPVWIPNDFMAAQGAEGRLPLYAPPTGESAGFHRTNIDRAIASGLKFRPLAETAKDSFDWYNSLPPEIQARVCQQLAAKGEGSWIEAEKLLLKAWREKK